MATMTKEGLEAYAACEAECEEMEKRKLALERTLNELHDEHTRLQQRMAKIRKTGMPEEEPEDDPEEAEASEL